MNPDVGPWSMNERTEREEAAQALTRELNRMITRPLSADLQYDRQKDTHTIQIRFGSSRAVTQRHNFTIAQARGLRQIRGGKKFIYDERMQPIPNLNINGGLVAPEELTTQFTTDHGAVLLGSYICSIGMQVTDQIIYRLACDENYYIHPPAIDKSEQATALQNMNCLRFAEKLKSM